MTSYRDLPKLTQSGNNSFSVPWVSLARTLDEYSTDVDPDFQRGHVWTRAQQSAYIEFRLSGGMTGREIHLNYETPLTPEQKTMLVDGKQRVTAVLDFLADKIPVWGLFRSEITDFPRMDPEVSFIFHVNDLKTRADVLQWYIEMNTGGMVHSAEEIARVRGLLNEEKAHG